MMKISVPKPKAERPSPLATVVRLVVVVVVLLICIPLAPKAWHNPFIQDMVSTSKEMKPEMKPVGIKDISKQMRTPTSLEKDAHGYNNLGGSKSTPNKEGYKAN